MTITLPYYIPLCSKIQIRTVTINFIDGGANTELKWERKHASIFSSIFWKLCKLCKYEDLGE